MAERMDIEDFFEEIDPDLLKYASAFRKCGFSSSVTMKYWREQDFQNLDVEVPEGHRRLILNMVTKIRTPELKSGENRSSFIPLTGKVDGNLRKSSVNSRRDISVAFHKSTFDESEPCKPLSSRTQSTKPHKLDLLSPVERFIKSKEDELKAKTEEIEQKKGEVETMLARVKEAASLTGRTGQRCSNCHQKNHTVRSCVEEKCESSFLCGDLSKHPDEKMAFQEKKRVIATLETSVKKVSQELTARQAGFSRVTNSVNKNFEDILMEEFPNEYMENGVRNWLKIQQDVAFIKKNFKSGSLPSREMVKSIVEKKYQDPLRLIEQRSNARKRQNTCPPMESKLASYGIEFPHKRSRRASASFLTPNSEEEEEEQFQMAAKLSLVDEPRCQKVCASGTTSQTNSSEEAASILLSLSHKQSED